MPELVKRSSSVYDYSLKRKKPDALRKKINQSGSQLTVGIIIGIFLAIVTLVLQCIAYFTPHWKEISPNTPSLYVDGIDALIRTETLVYFDSVHRFTRHSYGLFERCEFLLKNSSKLVHEQEAAVHIGFNHQIKRCTKNFLPSYADEKFNECHSLQYYLFCSKASERIFDINNDYLRATFDISYRNIESTSSCDCHYPKYVKACQILGIFALFFLFLTALFFTIFPFLKTRHQRLKIKCFGVLSSIFAMLFILTNLLVVLNHLEYESTEYLTAIERHYRISQIYKLSQDVKHAINQFTSSITIKIGYSTKIAWIAFILSIVDGILLMITCKITGDHDNLGFVFSAIPSHASQESDRNDNDAYQTLTTRFTAIQNTTDSQLPSSSHQQASSALIPTIVIDKCDEKSSSPTPSPPSCLKRSHAPRIHFEDEV